MNLWIRLFWLFLTARWRGRLTLPHDASKIIFRVWPHDLDLSMHMNNGRYLTLMDLGRLDVMVRSGLWRQVMQQRWTPIASSITIRFQRELRPLQRFRLQTKLACWTTSQVVMEQIFIFVDGPRDGQIAARALFKGGLYDRTTKSFVPLTELMRAIDVFAESPDQTAEIEAFLKTDETLRQGRTF